MVLTRFQRNACVNDVLIFVDVSGSTDEHTTKSFLADMIGDMCQEARGDVSLYTSNHDLQQRHFMNPGKMIPRQTFTFGGLSAVYDNVISALDYRFKYNQDTPCDVYIISDLEDNASMYNTRSDLNHRLQSIENFWNISIIHPINIASFKFISMS